MDPNENFPDLEAAMILERPPQNPDPVIPEGEAPYWERPMSSIGVTRASHEESKKRRKMAKASRKINRHK